MFSPRVSRAPQRLATSQGPRTGPPSFSSDPLFDTSVKINHGGGRNKKEKKKKRASVEGQSGSTLPEQQPPSYDTNMTSPYGPGEAFIRGPPGSHLEMRGPHPRTLEVFTLAVVVPGERKDNGGE